GYAVLRRYTRNSFQRMRLFSTFTIITPAKPYHRFALPRSNMMLYLRDVRAYAIDGKARVLDPRRASQRRI
ncbi:hypothetical protein FIBSPDRAFT_861735, partial [Athelia psychrophila]